MIEKYLGVFESKIAPELRKRYSEAHPGSYQSIFCDFITELNAVNCDRGKEYDLDKLHIIDDGDYQGTMLFLVPEKVYQPSTYLLCSVGYGSCSGCDTYEAIKDDYQGDYDERDKPSANQVEDYVTLAMHMFQALKEV